MSNTLASILVNMDVSSGENAINYTPSNGVCPILGFHCLRSSGSGEVKVTAYSATIISLESNTGSGGRLRIETDGIGAIKSVEIASSGNDYPDGIINTTLCDPYGTGGEIICEALEGKIIKANIISQGSGYSGYIKFDVSDFIEGVTYNIIPRFIEYSGDSNGSLKLIGYKLPYRPFGQF